MLRDKDWVHSPTKIEETVTNGRGFLPEGYKTVGFDALSVQMHLGNLEYIKNGSKNTLHQLAGVADLAIAAQTFGGRQNIYYQTPEQVIADTRAIGTTGIPDQRASAELVVLRRFSEVGVFRRFV